MPSPPEQYLERGILLLPHRRSIGSRLLLEWKHLPSARCIRSNVEPPSPGSGQQAARPDCSVQSSPRAATPKQAALRPPLAGTAIVSVVRREPSTRNSLASPPCSRPSIGIGGHLAMP